MKKRGTFFYDKLEASDGSHHLLTEIWRSKNSGFVSFEGFSHDFTC